MKKLIYLGNILASIGLAALVMVVPNVMGLLISEVMYWILGSQLATPLWTMVFDALVYVASFVVLFLGVRGVMRKFSISHQRGKGGEKAHSVAKKGVEKRSSKAESKQSAAETKQASVSMRPLLGLQGLPTWKDIGLAVAGFVVYAMLAGMISTLFRLFPWFNADEAQNVGFSNLYSAPDRILAFLAIAVVAPIMEELIFRGLLYGKIREHFKFAKEWVAILIATLITSVAFGIMHGQWNVGVDVFALSVVLCLMREVTGTIYSGMLVHMIKNTLAFFVLFVFTGL